MTDDRPEDRDMYLACWKSAAPKPMKESCKAIEHRVLIHSIGKRQQKFPKNTTFYRVKMNVGRKLGEKEVSHLMAQ